MARLRGGVGNPGRQALSGKAHRDLRGRHPGDIGNFSPGFPDRVFAHWYSGQVRLPMGQQLEYEHGGYASTYEQDLLIDFDQGVVSQTTLRQNSLPGQPNAL